MRCTIQANWCSAKPVWCTYFYMELKILMCVDSMELESSALILTRLGNKTRQRLGQDSETTRENWAYSTSFWNPWKMKRVFSVGVRTTLDWAMVLNMSWGHGIGKFGINFDVSKL